ncbi:MAG: hypothetical protein GC160_19730 [Acidobacteria bacterium]|nr:hypothetical protein [Acidobacteriota bacterium]
MAPRRVPPDATSHQSEARAVVRPAGPASEAAQPPEPPARSPAPDKSFDPSDARIDRMFDALRSAQRWVSTPPAEASEPADAPRRSGPKPSRSAPAEPSQTPVQPSAQAMQPAVTLAETRALRAAVQKVQPLTRVEIGSIEVEVVAPTRPPVAPAPRALPRGSGAPAFSARSAPSFGWRQR